MLSAPLVIAVSFAYLLLLFAVAYWADWRAAQGRSVISSPWVYALSMAVYCTAWTYFGSVGRAANSGVWFLPIYLGPMLAMILAWMVVRKMIRVAKTYRITSIADFIASRYGKSPLLAGLVTLITVVGIVPYIALQLKAVSGGYALLTTPLPNQLLTRQEGGKSWSGIRLEKLVAAWDKGKLHFPAMEVTLVSAGQAPHTVELPAIAGPDRRALGLPADKFLFLVMFDGNSWLSRKRAFMSAFSAATSSCLTASR